MFLSISTNDLFMANPLRKLQPDMISFRQRAEEVIRRNPRIRSHHFDRAFALGISLNDLADEATALRYLSDSDLRTIAQKESLLRSLARNQFLRNLPPPAEEGLVKSRFDKASVDIPIIENPEENIEAIRKALFQLKHRGLLEILASQDIQAYRVLFFRFALGNINARVPGMASVRRRLIQEGLPASLSKKSILTLEIRGLKKLHSFALRHLGEAPESTAGETGTDTRNISPSDEVSGREGEKNTSAFVTSLLDALPQYTVQERSDIKNAVLLAIDHADNADTVMEILKTMLEAWGINHLKRKLVSHGIPKVKWLTLHNGDTLSKAEVKSLSKSLGFSSVFIAKLTKGDKAVKKEAEQKLQKLVDISPDKTIAESYFELIKRRFGIGRSMLSLASMAKNAKCTIAELTVKLEEALELVEDLARKIDFENVAFAVEDHEIKLVRDIPAALILLEDAIRTKDMSDLKLIRAMAKSTTEARLKPNR